MDLHGDTKGERQCLLISFNKSIVSMVSVKNKIIAF